MGFQGLGCAKLGPVHQSGSDRCTIASLEDVSIKGFRGKVYILSRVAIRGQSGSDKSPILLLLDPSKIVLASYTPSSLSIFFRHPVL